MITKDEESTMERYYKKVQPLGTLTHLRRYRRSLALLPLPLLPASRLPPRAAPPRASLPWASFRGASFHGLGLRGRALGHALPAHPFYPLQALPPATSCATWGSTCHSLHRAATQPGACRGVPINRSLWDSVKGNPTNGMLLLNAARANTPSPGVKSMTPLMLKAFSRSS